MASIRRTIDVPASRDDVARAWVSFIDSVLVGRRRLACDELVCVDPVEAGVAGFDDLGGGRTRVTVTVPAADDLSESERELLGHKASHDLVLFWDYVESGEYRQDHAPEAVGRAALQDDVRRGRLTPPASSPDVEPFSVRRSGRT